MLLALLAGLVVLAALGWLGVALVRTWKQVVATGRSVAEAGERLADAAAGLNSTSETLRAPSGRTGP